MALQPQDTLGGERRTSVILHADIATMNAVATVNPRFSSEDGVVFRCAELADDRAREATIQGAE